MSNQASISDISSFLAQAKRLITAGDYVFVPRGKIYKLYQIMDLLSKMRKTKCLG